MTEHEFLAEMEERAQVARVQRGAATCPYKMALYELAQSFQITVEQVCAVRDAAIARLVSERDQRDEMIAEQQAVILSQAGDVLRAEGARDKARAAARKLAIVAGSLGSVLAGLALIRLLS